MTKQEFTQIAGYEVSDNDYYDIIEPMYMATNLSKKDFIQTLNKKRFALRPLTTIRREMRKCADQLKQTCTHYTDYATETQLDNLILEYIERKGYCAHYLITYDRRQGCSYPVQVTVYETSDYATLENIDLVV